MSSACAQAFVFFVAGFETSSSTTTYCLHELAQNLEIQEKLRKEINDTLGDRTMLTYEDVHAMSYLDKVVSGKWIIMIMVNEFFFLYFAFSNLTQFYFSLTLFITLSS